MSEQHAFIFTPGYWIGEGKVSFSTSPEHLHFYTRWEIYSEEEGAIDCLQLVEMQGINEKVSNHFTLRNITSEGFDITLENDLIGQVEGRGITGEKKIGWEFRGGSGLEGFETYSLVEGGDYKMHAEYASPDQFRSIIEGRIWKKSE